MKKNDQNQFQIGEVVLYKGWLVWPEIDSNLSNRQIWFDHNRQFLLLGKHPTSDLYWLGIEVGYKQRKSWLYERRLLPLSTSSLWVVYPETK
jgi:hypothetical protein